MEPPKNFLIFKEDGIFQARKIKKNTLSKFFVFREIELSNPKLKKLLHFPKKFFLRFQEGP